MKAIQYLILIIVIVGVAWFVVLQPIALGHAKDGFRKYIASIPISGNIEEKKTSYSLVWGFTPLKTEIEKLQMQGPRAEWEGKIFYDPVLSIEFVKLDPKKLMMEAEPEVLEIGHVDFEAKVLFRTLLDMFEERNPNFHARGIELFDDNTLKIVGVLQEVQSEVVILGDIKVSADGELEMNMTHFVDFLNTEITEIKKKEKIRNALIPKWKFRIIGVDLKIDQAALGPSGVYIKGESPGIKNLKPSEKNLNKNDER